MSKTQRTITLRLPWPPALNHYWRSIVIRGSVRVLLSAAGRKYREDAYAEIVCDHGTPEPLAGRLAVDIACIVPNRRRRDLDGIPKAVLDAMQHGGLYLDDSQIDLLTVRRLHVEPPGAVDVTICELE